ncbi:hypothetical protein F5B20DRAFT_591783 [Whalleya microplaca]|nr:hypothetical protein F5B20DRAFT_591783 [Whalleya microplaca]
MASDNYQSFELFREEIEEVQVYFDQADQQCFRWIGAVGYGEYGLCLRIKAQVTVNGIRSWKDFIIKRDIWHKEDSLRLESNRLKAFRGASHIVQILDLPGNPLDKPLPQPTPEWLEWDRLRQTHLLTSDSESDDDGSFRKKYLVLEYIPNGTLRDFIQKIRQSSNGAACLPNRLLRGLLLCLLKACLNMMSPNRAGLDDFFHTKLNLDNVMVGNLIPDDPEHSISPILKLISFGTDDVADRQEGEHEIHPDEPGIVKNLIYVATIMLQLITLDDQYIIDPEAIEDKLWTFWWLNHSLRDSIATCTYPGTYATVKERLADLVTQVEGDFFDQDYTWYRSHMTKWTRAELWRESDESILELLSDAGYTEG